MFLDFEYSTSTIGCCLFCQAPVGGNNRECITHGFDIICLNCAGRIAELVAVNKKHVCNKCGAMFDDKGSLLAHYREHKREEAQGA